MNINQQIAVMQAFSRGECIECCRPGGSIWEACPNPSWNWGGFEYRVAPPKPVVIQYKRYLCESIGGALRVATVNRGEAPAPSIRCWIDQVWQEYQP